MKATSEELTIFVAVVESGSFSRAAEQLGQANSAISRSVKKLEMKLGVSLLNRTTRQLSLTEEGRVFLQQARIAIGALDTAMDAVVARKMETRGHVRISTSAAFGCEQLLPVLPGLRARYPGISVEVDFDDRVTDLIADGYDLAIRGGHIVDSSLVSRPVCQLKTVLVASPGYLERCGVPTSPDDLAHHHLIARRFLSGRVSPWGFREQDGSLTTLEPDAAAVTLSAPEAQTQAELLGLGIAQVGVHHALVHLQSGALVRVLPKWKAPHGIFHAVYPSRRGLLPAVRVFIDYLVENLTKSKT